MTVGATSALDAVVTSGVAEGAVVARNVNPAPSAADSKQDATAPGTQQ